MSTVIQYENSIQSYLAQFQNTWSLSQLLTVSQNPEINFNISVCLPFPEFKDQIWSWDDVDVVRKEFAVQAWESEFEPDMDVRAWNPSTEEMERGGSLWLTGQPA